MGWRLLQGDAPYRDFYDQNWPGVMALHALAIWLFGVNLWSWRTLDFLVFAFTAIALSDLMRMAAGRGAWRVSLIILPLSYISASYLIAGQHDMSAAQILAIAIWFHVRSYSKNIVWWQFGTGVFLAAAVLNKPTVGVILVLLPLHAFWLGISRRKVLIHTLTVTSSALAVLVVSFGIVLRTGTSIQNILDCIYTLNIIMRERYGHLSFVFITKNIVQIRAAWFLPLMLASLPAAFWVSRRVNRSLAGTSLILMFLGGFLSYLIQGRGFHYHLAICLAALMAAQALAIELVASGRVRLGRPRWRRNLGTAFITASIAIIGAKVIVAFYSLPLALLQGDYERHLSRFPTGDNDARVVDVQAFVARLADVPASDCLLVVGQDSAMNYLARRKQPTRFYYSPVIEQARPPLPFAERWLDEWENDLNGADCHFVVISRRVQEEWLYGPGRAAESLRALLGRYHPTGTLGSRAGYIVYEKR